jgi:hypothetical protein
MDNEGKREEKKTTRTYRKRNMSSIRRCAVRNWLIKESRGLPM